MFASLSNKWKAAFVESENRTFNRSGLVVIVVFAVIVVLMLLFAPDLLGIFTAEAVEMNADVGGNYHYIRRVPTYKTLWDFLELIIVPVTLLTFGYLLGRSQNDRSERDADRREKSNQQIAADNMQETAMQAYLDAIAELLPSIRKKGDEGQDARELARMRTLTMLLRLNAQRQGYILLFLTNLGLIGTEEREPLINLAGARFQEVDLTNANVPEASFAHISLSNARLSRADMFGRDLSNANLAGCRLIEANLGAVNFSGANLQGAVLRGASLERAKLSGANLDQVNLTGANLNKVEFDDDTTWPDGFELPNSENGQSLTKNEN